MIALALVGLLTFQAPPPKVEQGKKSSNSSSSQSHATWPDRLAREKVKAFEKAVKPKKVSMADRKRALGELKGGVSQHLIKPLQKFIEKDSSIVLKREAVQMLAVQPTSPPRRPC